MPSVRDTMYGSQVAPASSSLATPKSTPKLSKAGSLRGGDDRTEEVDEHFDDYEREETTNRALFGNVPFAKRRKFLLIDDEDKNIKARVRVGLDQVNMHDMPDMHLRMNSVFPRSYYARTMKSPASGAGDGSRNQRRAFWGEEGSRNDATITKTLVQVETVDGQHIELPVPRMSKSKRKQEVDTNEIGYRMSWGQARTFDRRKLFLQRSSKCE